MNLPEFFQGYDEAQRIFQHVLAEIALLGPFEMRIGKSQVGFYRPRGFAYAWIPQRVLKRPGAPLVLSVPLHRRDASPAWKEVVEPNKGRFMHHVELWSPDALSDEIMACVKEAYGEAKALMQRGDPDWRRLAFAFYSLAHNDPQDFHALEAELQETEVGRLCVAYLRTGDHDLLEQAGYLLTGTHQWYIYLGRIM